MELQKLKEVYPKPPLNPKILEQTEDSLTMGWDNKGNYNIYLDGNKIDTIKNTFYTFTGLDPNKEYQLCVAPVSSMGEGEKVCLTGKTKVKIEEVVVIPKRVDIDTGETQQMTIQTLPPEALEQYSYKIEPILDGSIIEVEGDKVKGLKEVNDSRLGRNLLQNSEQTSFIKNGKYLLEKELNVRVEEWNCSNAVLYKAFKPEKAFLGVIQDAKNNQIKKGERCILSVYVKNVGDSDLSFTFFSKEYTVLAGESKRVTIVDRLTTEKGYLQLAISIKNAEEVSNASFILWRGKFEITDRESVSSWTPAPEDNYSYTNAKVVFNDKAKSEKEIEVFVHKPKNQESLTEPEIVNNTL